MAARDLASGMQLAWTPVADATAAKLVATQHGRHDHWSANNLYAAQLWGHEAHYPGRFAARLPIDEKERDTFRAVVLQYEQSDHDAACSAGDPLTDTLIAVHHRRAVRQALVEISHLDTARRSIPQPLHSAKRARIT